MVFLWFSYGFTLSRGKPHHFLGRLQGLASAYGKLTDGLVERSVEAERDGGEGDVFGEIPMEKP